MPSDTVKVDRSTRWGNPLRTAPGYPAAQAVADFERWVNGDAQARFSDLPAPPSHAQIRLHLAGKNLACWCPEGQPCHADVLLTLANP
jgi:Domain of unknown function (DUF4326)